MFYQDNSEQAAETLAGLRIALVCPYSWTTPGGVATHVAGLARELRRRGAEVDVLAPADGPVDLPGFVPLGGTVAFSWEGTVTRVALAPAAAARTVRALRRGRYDVVHVHEPMLPAAGLAAVAGSPAPVVATFHMTARSALWYRLFTPVVRFAARRIAVRIAVSDAARAYVARSLPGDYRIVPNAIDTAPFAAVARRDGGDAPPCVLFVGRGEPRKGLPVLLDAFDRLEPPARLTVVGADVPGRADVRTLGRLSVEELTAVMADADVFCAPSLGGESFGIVLVEAMAAGLPVVASDIPGYAAVLPPSAGRLVPPGDAGALARALAELLADPDLRRRMGEAAREQAARFDWSRVADEVVAVYREALA